jgi:GNAT superfamily N-acetyltransferase
MTSSQGLRFRSFFAEDHSTFLRLFAELGVDDPPPDLDRFLGLAPSSFFAEDEAGAIVGYTHYELLETEGYVRHVVVAPGARGRGVGRSLMDEVARRFRAGGCTQWRLNVKAHNVPARRLYASCGMAEAYRTRVVRITWEHLGALPASERPARELGGREHATYEDAVGIPRKLLANLGQRGFVALGTDDPSGAPVGAAAFDPRFPGAFPFRARSLAAARALLDAALARRVRIDDAERPWRDAGVQVVAEDSDLVADALVAAGGAEVMATLHYLGPL